MAEENGELMICFEYRPDEEKRKQYVINDETAKRVMGDLNEEKLVAWQQRLGAKWKPAVGTESEKINAMGDWYTQSMNNLSLIGKRYKNGWKLKPEVRKMHDLTKEEMIRFEKKLQDRLTEMEAVKIEG